MFSYSEYIFSIIVLLLVSGIVTRMLIHPHDSPVLRNSTAQIADGDFIVRAPGSPSSPIFRSPRDYGILRTLNILRSMWTLFLSSQMNERILHCRKPLSNEQLHRFVFRSVFCNIRNICHVCVCWERPQQSSILLP